MNKYKNLLTSTTIIPLWAKAVDYVDNDPILNDSHAGEVLSSLGYTLDSYSKKKQNPSQVGCCLRAKWMDDETLKFINDNEQCQVIQLGAGLDDRFRRIGMPGNVNVWYDLDLPEVMQMRKDTIPQQERNVYIAEDMFETHWLREMQKNDIPALIIIEGVMMYLNAGLVTKLMNNIARFLPGATVLFDSVPCMAVGRARYHDAVQKYNKDVEYTWGLKDAEDIENISSRVHNKEFVYMSDLPKAYKFRMLLRLIYKIPYFYRNANQMLIKIEIR